MCCFYFQSLGAEIITSTRNVSRVEDVKLLVSETNNRPVGGIFHLAMVCFNLTLSLLPKFEFRLVIIKNAV